MLSLQVSSNNNGNYKNKGNPIEIFRSPSRSLQQHSIVTLSVLLQSIRMTPFKMGWQWSCGLLVALLVVSAGCCPLRKEVLSPSASPLRRSPRRLDSSPLLPSQQARTSRDRPEGQEALPSSSQGRAEGEAISSSPRRSSRLSRSSSPREEPPVGVVVPAAGERRTEFSSPRRSSRLSRTSSPSGELPSTGQTTSAVASPGSVGLIPPSAFPLMRWESPAVSAGSS